jgi:proteasome accessory factor B
VRTAYRDLRALESELGIPIWENRGRFGTEQSAFLPPLKLSLLEAVTLFLSARLMARYADRKDKHVLSAFGKLASVLPAPIARHVDATIASMGDGPLDDHYATVFDVVASAWANSRKVRILYPRTGADGQTLTVERVVAPIFLQPNAAGHGCYLIAHDDLTRHSRTFKLERIERAELTDEEFEPPSDSELPAHLANAWTVSDGELITVRVRFHDAAAAKRAQENRWHPSQQQKFMPDGRLELSFSVAGILEITPWILSWGDTLEVLEPTALRDRISDIARGLLHRYMPPESGQVPAGNQNVDALAVAARV